MANKKISGLAPGGIPQNDDELPVARQVGLAKSNFKISVGELIAEAAFAALDEFYAQGIGGTTTLVSYGDSTPSDIYYLDSNQTINGIDIAVIEAWDGIGASIQIGTPAQPGLLFDSLESELSAVATFSKDFTALGPMTIRVTITPGTSPTTGKARIQISTTPRGT